MLTSSSIGRTPAAVISQPCVRARPNAAHGSAPSTSYSRPDTCTSRRAPRQRWLAARAAAVAEASTGLDVSTMEPVADRVLVRPREEEKRTSSGLIMPVSGGKGMADALIGEVLAVGEDVKLEVAKGDVVIFSKYSSSDVSLPDGEVCFVAEKSIMAKLS